jgi:nucleotide-binding universal stress UspA family protein
MGTIVCAVDDSPAAGEVLRVAARLSCAFGVRLVVAHVEAAPNASTAARAAAEHRGRQLLARLAAAQGLNGGADRRVEVGERARELVRVAVEEAASLLVVGSGPRHWWQSARASRLASDLAATAPCPIVVVPLSGRY